MIGWNDSLSVGDAELDRQHRKWIGFIEALQRAETEDGDPRTLHDIVDEMEIYVRYHFCSEERMLERAGYADLEEHRREHEAMSRRIQDLVADFKGGDGADRARVVDILWSWLMEHIMVSDHEYRDTLAAVPADRG